MAEKQVKILLVILTSFIYPQNILPSGRNTINTTLNKMKITAVAPILTKTALFHRLYPNNIIIANRKKGVNSGNPIGLSKLTYINDIRANSAARPK